MNCPVISGRGNETKFLLMSSSDDMGAMNRYVTLQPLGDGTYGSVMLGQRVDTGEKVNINTEQFRVKKLCVSSRQYKQYH